MQRPLSGLPLQGTDGDARLFVGREELVNRCALAAALGANVLVVGPPGIGRSSTLHQVERRLRASGVACVWVDGAGLDDPGDLLLITLTTLGVTVASSAGNRVPSLLAAVPRRDEQVCLLIDDLEATANRGLFGQWRQHMWRLNAQVVATAAGDDAVLHLEHGADAWWEEVYEIEGLTPEEASAMISRRAGSAQNVPTDAEMWIRDAGGSPRELMRMLRSHMITAADSQAVHRPPDAAIWSQTDSASVDELSGVEHKLMALIRERGHFAVADPDDRGAAGLSQPAAFRAVGRLATRGLVVRREERTGGRGRPRIVYYPTLAEAR